MSQSTGIALSELTPNEHLEVLDFAKKIYFAADQSTYWKSIDDKARDTLALKIANLDKLSTAKLIEIALIGRGGNPEYKRGFTRNITPKVEWIEDFVDAPITTRPEVFSKIAKEAAELAKDQAVDVKTAVSALSIGFSASYFTGAALVGAVMGPVAGTALATHALNSGIAHFAAPKVLEYVGDKAAERLADLVDDARIPDGAKSAVQFGIVLFKLAGVQYGSKGLDGLLDLASEGKRPELVEQLTKMLSDHGLAQTSELLESSAGALRLFRKETLEKLSAGASVSEEEIEHLIEASKQVKDTLKDEGDALVKAMASKSARLATKQQDSALVLHAQSPVGSSMSSESVDMFILSDKGNPEAQTKGRRIPLRMRHVADPNTAVAPQEGVKLLARAEVYLTLGMDDPTFEKYRKSGWIAKSAMLFVHVPTPGESRAAGMAAAIEKLGPSTALRAKLALVVQTAQTINTVKILAVLAGKGLIKSGKRALGFGEAKTASTGVLPFQARSYQAGLARIKSSLNAKKKLPPIPLPPPSDHGKRAPN